MNDIDKAILKLKSTIEEVRNISVFMLDGDERTRADQLLQVTINTFEQCEIWLTTIRDQIEAAKTKKRENS